MKKIQADVSGLVPKARVVWCGGEVLLERDIVLNMTRRIRKKAERMGRVAEFSMIGNCSATRLESRSTNELAGLPVMTVSEFAKLERRIQIDHPDSKRSIFKRLLPRPHHCAASAMNLFVVDPGGCVSRCMKSAGIRSEATGHVLTDRESKPMRACEQQWRDYSPFRDPVCMDCKVLPLCMGGCPHVPLFSAEKGRRQCIPIRDQVQHFAERAARSLQSAPPQSVLI